MPTDLLSLPLEVHRSIFGLLNYGDLFCLRVTCRYLNQIEARDIVDRALTELEHDCVEARIMFEEERDRTRKGHKSFYSYDDHPDEATFDFLHDMGDRYEHIRGFTRSLPCYEYLRLRPTEDHLYQHSLIHVAERSAVVTLSHQQLPSTAPSRKCIECLLQSPDYLDTRGGRWVCVDEKDRYSGRSDAHYWLAICRSCGQEVYTKRKPLARQRLTDLCRPCFRESHKDWFDFFDNIGREGHRISQETERLAQRDQVLYEYAAWMEDVDDGRGLGEVRPADLSDTVVPQWEDVRADAVERLPGYREPDPYSARSWLIRRHSD